MRVGVRRNGPALEHGNQHRAQCGRLGGPRGHGHCSSHWLDPAGKGGWVICTAGLGRVRSLALPSSKHPAHSWHETEHSSSRSHPCSHPCPCPHSHNISVLLLISISCHSHPHPISIPHPIPSYLHPYPIPFHLHPSLPHQAQTFSSYSSRVSMVSQRRSCFKSTSSLNDCRRNRDRWAVSSPVPPAVLPAL